MDARCVGVAVEAAEVEVARVAERVVLARAPARLRRGRGGAQRPPAPPPQAPHQAREPEPAAPAEAAAPPPAGASAAAAPVPPSRHGTGATTARQPSAAAAPRVHLGAVAPPLTTRGLPRQGERRSGAGASGSGEPPPETGGKQQDGDQGLGRAAWE